MRAPCARYRPARRVLGHAHLSPRKGKKRMEIKRDTKNQSIQELAATEHAAKEKETPWRNGLVVRHMPKEQARKSPNAG